MIQHLKNYSCCSTKFPPTRFIYDNAFKDNEGRGSINERAMKTFVEDNKGRKDGCLLLLDSQTSAIAHGKYRKGVDTKESNILKAEVEASNPARVTRTNMD